MPYPKLNRLVVIVPGCGGSTLVDDSGDVVWGGPLPRFARQFLIPGAIALDQNPRLRPTGLLQVARNLPGFASVHPYDRLIGAIRRAFPDVIYDEGRPESRNLDADLVAFPYDFRLSLVQAAHALDREVNERANHLGLTRARPRVVIIAHSLGGLVARYWLGPLGGAGLCECLLTLGAPHRGAPKALDWLVNGVRILGLPHAEATEVIRSWPSIYELLPRYKAVLSEGAWRYPHDLPIPILGDRARAAFAVHEEIEAAWSTAEQRSLARSGQIPGDARPRVYPFFGHGHATRASATFDAGVLAFRDYEAHLDPDGWLGDETVPQVAAIPIEMSDDPQLRDRWRPTSHRHGPLAAAKEIIAELRVLAGASLSAVRGPGAGDASIGLELPDTHPAGLPLLVRATVSRVGHPRPTSLVSIGNVRARVTPERRPDLSRVVAMAPEGTGWACQVDGLDPGIYEVEVVAESPSGSRLEPVSDWVTVVLEE